MPSKEVDEPLTSLSMRGGKKRLQKARIQAKHGSSKICRCRLDEADVQLIIGCLECCLTPEGPAIMAPSEGDHARRLIRKFKRRVD